MDGSRELWSELERQASNFCKAGFPGAAGVDDLRLRLEIQELARLEFWKKVDVRELMAREVPFLVAVPDLEVGIAKQQELLTGWRWSQRQPERSKFSSRTEFQRHYRIALDVRAGPPLGRPGPVLHESIREVRQQRLHLDAAEGLALWLHFPDFLKKLLYENGSGSFTLMEGAQDEHTSMSLDFLSKEQAERDLDRAPAGVPHLRSHAMGPMVWDGSCPRNLTCKTRVAAIEGASESDRRARREFGKTAFDKVMVQWPEERWLEREAANVMES